MMKTKMFSSILLRFLFPTVLDDVIDATWDWISTCSIVPQHKVISFYNE